MNDAGTGDSRRECPPAIASRRVRIGAVDVTRSVNIMRLAHTSQLAPNVSAQ